MIGILLENWIHNRNGVFGVYKRMLAVCPSQKRQRVKNRGFTIIRIVLVYLLQGSGELMVEFGQRTGVRPEKDCRGFYVVLFSLGLGDECPAF